MKIGLDVRMVQYSGIGTTIRSLLDNWDVNQLERLMLFGAPGWENPTAAPVMHVPYTVYGLRQHWGYARLLTSQNLSLFHMPHFDVPFLYKGPFIVTVHDLIHLLFPQFSTKPFSKIYSWMMLRHAAKKAVRIITVSENTRRDLVRFFPEAEPKTKVISPGIGKNFSPVQGDRLGKILDTYHLMPGYLLYVGNLRGSKNTKGLLEAYHLLRSRRKDIPPLVLVGRNFYPEFENGNFPDGVLYLGEVSSGDLPALYSGASLFIFPSFYEGFGLPPLEAMACGTPVVASRVASLPEVCGEAAVFFDPASPADIANKIRMVLDSLSLHESMGEKGLQNVKRFDERRYAQDVWKVYEEALA